MKLNLGIRRRLAPLLDNGRDEIQLMTAILFSLPGSPVLYYGDEIAMGDNVSSATATGCAPRCNDRWTATAASRARIRAAVRAAADGPGVRLPGS